VVMLTLGSNDILTLVLVILEEICNLVCLSCRRLQTKSSQFGAVFLVIPHSCMLSLPKYLPESKNCELKTSGKGCLKANFLTFAVAARFPFFNID